MFTQSTDSTICTSDNTPIDGVTITQIPLVNNDSKQTVCVTKIVPDTFTVDRGRESPVGVGSGGVNHPTILYKQFLAELAKKTGGAFFWYDSPRTGTSPSQSVDYQTLADTLKGVVQYVQPHDPVSLLGHSLGTIAVRALATDPNLGIQIDKKIMFAHVPAAQEKISMINPLYFIMSGLGLISRFNIIHPGPHAAANFYANEHSSATQQWIQDIISEDYFHVGLGQFLSALGEVSRHPLNLQDPSTCMMIGTKDRAISANPKIDTTNNTSVHVIKGGDHDSIVLPPHATNQTELNVFDQALNFTSTCLTTPQISSDQSLK